MLRDKSLPTILRLSCCLDWDPCSETSDDRRDRILTMDAKLRERVIGQEEAIQVVTEAVQRSCRTE
jgi:hypothetical protein